MAEKIRSPKSENPKEIRKPKAGTSAAALLGDGAARFGLLS
jgi:hypothetical protein